MGGARSVLAILLTKGVADEHTVDEAALRAHIADPSGACLKALTAATSSE